MSLLSIFRAGNLRPRIITPPARILRIVPVCSVIFLCLNSSPACFAQQKAISVATHKTIWNPLQRQEREADTLYLLDGDREPRLVAGDGGLIPGDVFKDKAWTKVILVAGKFRQGLRSLDREFGYVWMPSIGMISPKEFTIEFWLKSDMPWEQIPDDFPLQIWDENRSVNLQIGISGGKLSVLYEHGQSEAGPVQAKLEFDLRRNPIPAQQWTQVAITCKNGSLCLYVNGAPVAKADNLAPLRVWSDAYRSDGLSLCGGRGRGGVHFTLSDLRISRFARIPNTPVSISAENSLEILAQKRTGLTVRQTLLGGLHKLGNPKTEAMAKGVLRVIRTDKLLTVTPIKAGAPDETHPTKGVSGKYAYDWQVVDRTFDYYQRLNVVPYISLDSTPQILGGKTPPFRGSQLASGLSWASGFTPEVPQDREAFGIIVRDLVYHVVIEKRYRVPHWGVWNEPDGGEFWNNSLPDYLRLYETCARAVKSVDPKLKVGGPESAHYNPVWIEGLIKYCAQNKTPLDFISWHYYLSTVGEIPLADAQIRYWTRKYNLPRAPERIIGEWAWQIHNVPITGYPPWRTRNYFLNDWHAAFVGASLIEMQNAGVIYSIYTNPVAEDKRPGFEASGLMSSEHPWANLNVYQLWSKLYPDIVSSRYDGVPGVFSLASRNARGDLTILLASLKYRKEKDTEVVIRLPEVRNGARITRYTVDDKNANRFDAGPEHTELEPQSLPPLIQQTIRLYVRSRSVTLLIVSSENSDSDASVTLR